MDRLPESVAAPLAEPAHRRLCTDCGISRSSDPHRCGRACQFIEPDYERLERRVHGRTRDAVEAQRLRIRALLGDACRGDEVLYSSAILKKTGLRIKEG